MADYPALPDALTGDRREIRGRSGRLSFYVTGRGAPILLIHSINAAASAYEVRPVYERLAANRRVFAVDLPGFGFSDRSPRDYTVDLYVAALVDMLDEIARDVGNEGAIDALAVSLGAEFLARLAVREPARLRTLTFVTPTGFDRRTASGGRRGEIPILRRLVESRYAGDTLFAALTSEKSIRYFLRKTFGRDEIDEGLARYCYLTAHQPGAKHAPAAFVSGRLFSPDIRDVYRSLVQPVWMPHATRGDFKDMSGADAVRCRPGWTVQPFPTGALPHFEEPERFNGLLERFLANGGRFGRDAA